MTGFLSFNPLLKTPVQSIRASFQLPLHKIETIATTINNCRCITTQPRIECVSFGFMCVKGDVTSFGVRDQGEWEDVSII